MITVFVGAPLSFHLSLLYQSVYWLQYTDSYLTLFSCCHFIQCLTSSLANLGSAKRNSLVPSASLNPLKFLQETMYNIMYVHITLLKINLRTLTTPSLLWGLSNSPLLRPHTESTRSLDSVAMYWSVSHRGSLATPVPQSGGQRGQLFIQHSKVAKIHI